MKNPQFVRGKLIAPLGLWHTSLESGATSFAIFASSGFSPSVDSGVAIEYIRSQITGKLTCPK